MKLADRVVELMLTGKRGEVWPVRAVAAALGVPRGDVTDAVSKLRYAGKVDWQKLKLAPSMWPIEVAAACTPPATPPAPVGKVVHDASPTPESDPERKPASKRGPGKGRVEPVSRPVAGRSATAASERMDATGGETPPAPPVTPAARETAAQRASTAIEVTRRSLAQQVHDEAIAAAANRKAARRLSGTSAARVKMPLRELVERECLAEPADALTVLRRRWPTLLDELVACSRAQGQSVAEMLHNVIEGGLALVGNGGRQ